MSFPSPTERQARLFWIALTALAVAVLVGAAGLVLAAIGWLANKLTVVLLPLAVAGILAYLLDPVVGWFERRGLTRTRAILWVFILAAAAGLMFLATVLPRLIMETSDLVRRAPQHYDQLQTRATDWARQSPLAARAQVAWESETGGELRVWLQNRLPDAGRWALARAGRLLSGFGMVLGFAFLPFYLFYILRHKTAIEQAWTDYLPVAQSRFKDELVFIIRAINDALIVFFRGQVLVAFCVGLLATVGYWLIGLQYAFVLGAVAGVLGIIPYLGAFISLVAALALAVVQFQNWQGPVLVVVVYGVVQAIESAVISPRIIGDRVGMHPVTVIVAVLIGTALLGGIVGGVLAIPLAAALRAVLRRYVWQPAAGKS